MAPRPHFRTCSILLKVWRIADIGDISNLREFLLFDKSKRLNCTNFVSRSLHPNVTLALFSPLESDAGCTFNNALCRTALFGTAPVSAHAPEVGAADSSSDSASAGATAENLSVLNHGHCLKKMFFPEVNGG